MHDNDPRYIAAQEYADTHGISIEEAFHDDEFRITWNDYVIYSQTGKMTKGRSKRKGEKILNRPFSKRR